MSRRREVAKRLEALSDIAGIMSAMKGLALMEVRILTDFLASQRLMVEGIEAAAGDFLASYPGYAAAPASGDELWVIVGSEQGFCGDFNEALLGAVEGLRWGAVRRVVVGQRLAARLSARGGRDLVLPGAIVADEVPAVLLGLTRELGELLARDDPPARGVSVVYHCDATREIRVRRLLPLGELPRPRRVRGYATESNLEPADFLRGLTRHYLLAALNEVLYSSLMAENRQRQMHMDRALQRLDEDTARLRLVYNARRQEEITEEIEVILLSAEMLSRPRHQP
jgi:F-type H+-transporting ATPase subunit gamma